MKRTCHYPDQKRHWIPDGTTYWQTAEHGDICDDCHKQYYLPSKQEKPITDEGFSILPSLLGPMPPQRATQASLLCCSFCGKAEEDVALVTGPKGLFICQECVELSYAMFECRHKYCHNRAKRSSGFCACCDSVYNHGRGKRLKEA